MPTKGHRLWPEAKADYRKILEMNPQDQFAKKQLEELSSGKQ